MSKKFIVTIGADGLISAETSDITGAACLDELATIEALVPDARVLDSRLTGDYYRAAVQEQHLPVQNTVKDQRGQA